MAVEEGAMTQHAKQRAHFLPFFHDIITSDTYGPCGRPGQSRENPQERCLASTIRSKETQTTSMLEFEINASESCYSTKMFYDTFKVHHCFGAHTALLRVSIAFGLASLLCSSSISLQSCS